MYEIAGDFTNKYFNYADPTLCRQEHVTDQQDDAFHGKRDTYNCTIDADISNKSRTLLIGHSYFYQS